jgi:5'(3')-deoxyribonucleotidase
MNSPIILNKINDVDDNPYFFKNLNISDKIYIAQKATSEENALYICDVWNNHKYNIGNTTNIINIKIPFNRYLYNANDNIELQKELGGNDDYNVLIYKYNKKLNYVALLEFNSIIF